jgi:carbon monoxide dehydrogenase subunit G
MTKFSRTELIEAPPEQVFDFVTNQENLPKWSPEVVRSEVVGGRPIEAGAKLRQVRRQGGRQMTNEVEVVAHNRPSRHAVKARIMGVDASFAFDFAPEGAGTRVRFACEMDAHGVAKLWAGYIARMVEKTDDKRLANLKTAIASAKN